MVFFHRNIIINAFLKMLHAKATNVMQVYSKHSTMRKNCNVVFLFFLNRRASSPNDQFPKRSIPGKSKFTNTKKYPWSSSKISVHNQCHVEIHSLLCVFFDQ